MMEGYLEYYHPFSFITVIYLPGLLGQETKGLTVFESSCGQSPHKWGI